VSAIVNPLWLGIIVFALAWAVLSTMGSPAQSELLLVVLLYLVLLFLLHRQYAQFKKTLAVWQDAPDCWIELPRKPDNASSWRWTLSQQRPRREFAYALLGAILDGALSLAALVWLFVAVCEIIGALVPTSPALAYLDMPGGIVSSIFGWRPLTDGYVYDPSLWLRFTDGVLGLVGLAAWVPIVMWCARGQVGLTRLFLAPSTAETARRLADVQAAKDSAAQAETSTMTRIERDLHDGPQQKLIRLSLDLDALRRRLDAGDADAAKQLAAEMKTRTDDVLAEIRLLSRGFAPPVLADRGLAEAVVALAAASPAPTTVDADLPDDRLPDQAERAVYFAVSEALANVTKHASASAAQVRLSMADGLLTATVIDDGIGGATMQPGHGLAGLADRMAGVMGTLTLDSEPGSCSPPAPGVSAIY